MAAFLVTSPSSMANSRRRSGGGIGGGSGGMSMENVAEEVLDVMFCHYEPPTSERSQLRAAKLAQSDPAKYAIRKASKPILKLPSMAERRGITITDDANTNRSSGGSNENHDTSNSDKNVSSSINNCNIGESILFKLARDLPNCNGTSSCSVEAAKDNTNTSTGDATTTVLTKKSVTWRDEQSKTNHNRGSGSGEQNAAGCSTYHCGFFKQSEGLVDILMSPTNKNKKGSEGAAAAAAAGPPTPVLKKLTADTPTSAVSNGTGMSSPANTYATSVTTSTTSMKSRDGASTTASGDPPSTAGVLYDDLGNPIQEGREDDDEDNRSSVAGTPTSQQQEMAINKIARNGEGGGAGDSASSGDSMNGSFSYFFAAPMAVAASMMGTGKKTTDGSNTNESGSATTNDRLGIYEPEDYDKPGAYREQQLPYREARSPTPLKRIPTPRYDHTNGFGAEEQSEDERGVQSPGKSSPGRLNRETTPFLRDEDPARSPLGKDAMNIRIPGSGSNTPRKTFPSGRSDVYSDITEDEQAYLQKRGATPVEADDEFLYFYDDKGNLLARRRPQSIRSDSKSKLTKNEEDKIFYHTPVAAKPLGVDTAMEQKDVPDVPEEDVKEEMEEGGGEHLTPREYFKRLDEANRRKRADDEQNCQSSTLKTTKKEPVATKKGSIQREERQEEAERARDPTPRNGSAPKDDGSKVSSVTLPPTPRRDSGGALPPTPRREEVERETLELNKARSRRSSFEKDATPRSMANTMATDAEIREEVSSVGLMTPSTLRPVQKYSSQSRRVPESIPKILPVPERKGRTEQKASGETSRSTLTSHPSKASHRGEKSKRSSRKKEKTRTKSSDQSHRSKSSNRSGSTTQSKKGWLGRVKQVVNDFEEDRLPLPAHLRRARSQERKRSTKTKRRR
mmetsp:Transcript_32024/g.77951  ORF Transcript_32024/g.77951 Transcript_32024/m.77951 type:complete len:905 (+) Transcript_32024:342-3056(+)